MDYEKDFEDGYEHTSVCALHFRHHPGTREKIIFLHGIGSNTKAWKRLMEYLPSELDIFLIDLLGHGESDAPQIDYTISTQFQALREFIAMQNNGDSYLFGHSYGGWIAAYYASQPTGCKGIMLEDCAGEKEFFDELLKSGNKDKYNENLLNLAMMVSGNKEYVLKSIIELGTTEDQLDHNLLSQINTRTMIIWGGDDKVLDPKYAQILSEEIKGSTLKIINGAGHDPHFTNAKEISDLIMLFIRS